MTSAKGLRCFEYTLFFSVVLKKKSQTDNKMKIYVKYKENLYFAFLTIFTAGVWKERLTISADWIQPHCLKLAYN